MTHYNLRALQVFECVYRHRSLKLAAHELSITSSAISHQLRHLRMQIGEDLIEKSGRNIVFTERGVRLAESLAYAFTYIGHSVQKSISNDPETLRVAVCTALGSGWLIKRLARYPKLGDFNLQVKLHAQQPALSDCNADIFFTTEPLKDGYNSAHIMTEELLAVCSPDMNSDRPLMLITTDLDERNYGKDWSTFAVAADRQHELSTARLLGTSHYIFAAKMAEKALGVALVPEFLVEDKLREGRLVLWSDLRVSSGRSYYMSAKYSRRHEPNIKHFMSWVRLKLAGVPKMDGALIPSAAEAVPPTLMHARSG